MHMCFFTQCVCVYVYICVCVYVYIYVYMYVCIYVCIYINMCVYTYTNHIHTFGFLSSAFKRVQAHDRPLSSA